MRYLMGIRENKALRAVIGTIVMVWKVSWRSGERHEVRLRWSHLSCLK